MNLRGKNERYTVPPVMQQFADLVWVELGQTALANTTAGFLHIRKGDTTEQCNTSLAVMQDYITCSFNGTKSLGSLSILLASDERSPAYRAEVRNMLLDVGVHHFLDIDAYLKVKLEETLPAKHHNNHYLFRVGSLISERAAFTLQK
jgi:hypothetical protein